MNGLVIAGGEAPQRCVELDRRDNWFVVAADSGLESALRYGITPDVAIGDMDSISDQRLLDRLSNVIVEQYPADKDHTDTELALNRVWQTGIEHVTILGGGGGRLDHLLAIIRLFDRPRVPQRWITANEDVVFIENAVDLSRAYGETISVFPVGRGPWVTQSSGLRWELTDLEWLYGDIGISNRVVSDQCRIEVLSGRLLLIRALSEHPLLLPGGPSNR